MHLVRDLLDKQLVDKSDHRIGKIDGLVVELKRGEQPEVVALELGRGVVSDRLIASLVPRKGRRRSRSFRIHWWDVVEVDVSVKVDVDRSQVPVERWQQWLRDNVLSHIPGGS